MEIILHQLATILKRYDAKNYYPDLIEFAYKASKCKTNSYKTYELVLALNSALKKVGYYG